MRGSSGARRGRQGHAGECRGTPGSSGARRDAFSTLLNVLSFHVSVYFITYSIKSTMQDFFVLSSIADSKNIFQLTEKLLRQ